MHAWFASTIVLIVLLVATSDIKDTVHSACRPVEPGPAHLEQQP